MRGQHYGAAFGVDRAHEVPEVAARLRVERRGRLVEEHQLGVAHQRAGDGQPLLLAAGELLAADVRVLGEPHELEHLAAAGLPGPVELRERVDLLLRGEELEERRRLELHAEAAGQLGGVRPRGPPEEAHGPGVGLAQALDDLEGRGLPGSVGAEDPEELAAFDAEAHPVDGVDLTGPAAAIGLAEVGDLDGGVHTG
jgi:hypothetical protein